MGRLSQPSKEPVSTRSMLTDLFNARQALTHLQGQNQEYDPLLNAILSTPQDNGLPAVKVLQKQCSTTPARFKRWLQVLHQDFIAAIEARTLLEFTQAEHCFVVSGPRDYLSFRCRIPSTPRPGDRIELGFVSGITGSSEFYVDSTVAEYNEGTITTYVYLRAGYYDAYFHQLRARARFEGKLLYTEERAMDDHQLKDFLRELYC